MTKLERLMNEYHELEQIYTKFDNARATVKTVENGGIALSCELNAARREVESRYNQEHQRVVHVRGQVQAAFTGLAFANEILRSLLLVKELR